MHRRRRLKLMTFRGLIWKCGSGLSASPQSAKSSLRRRSLVPRWTSKVERKRNRMRRPWLDNFKPIMSNNPNPPNLIGNSVEEMKESAQGKRGFAYVNFGVPGLKTKRVREFTRGELHPSAVASS